MATVAVAVLLGVASSDLWPTGTAPRLPTPSAAPDTMATEFTTPTMGPIGSSSATTGTVPSSEPISLFDLPDEDFATFLQR